MVETSEELKLLLDILRGSVFTFLIEINVSAPWRQDVDPMLIQQPKFHEH